MSNVRRLRQGVFNCGHGNDRGGADAFRHWFNLALAEAARLTDDLDVDEVRDLGSKLDRLTVDRNVADREPLRGRHLEDRPHGMIGIAAQDFPVLLRVRSIRRLPAVSREASDVEGHRIGNAYIRLLSSKLVYLRPDMRIAVAFRLS